MACLAALAAAAVAVLVALASSLLAATPAFASGTATTCTTGNGSSLTAAVFDVVLGDGTTTIYDDGGLFDYLSTNNATAASCGALGTSSTTVNFTVATSASPSSLVFEQTVTGTSFPASVTFAGTVSASGDATTTINVDGVAGESIAVGSEGLNLNYLATGNTGYTAGTLTGVASYDLVAGAGPVTLSAAGQGGTGGPATVPVTLDGTAGGADTFVAGDSSEIFEAGSTGSTGSTLDFSQVTCPSTSCSLAANATAGNVNAGTVTVSSGTAQLIPASASGYTYSFATNPSDFTVINGNQVIPTSYYAAPSSTLTLDSWVNLYGTGAGTYNVTVSGSHDSVTAGSGAENVNATASSTTFTAGSGSDTFTVTGSSNTFNAGAGNDAFYDTGSSNTVSFAAVASTQTAPLTVDLNAGTATNGSVSDVFQTSSPTPFSTIDGSAGGSTTFKAATTGGYDLVGAGTDNSVDFSPLTANGVVVNLSGVSQTVSVPISSTVALSGFSLGTGQALLAPPASGVTACSASTCDTLSDITSVSGSSDGFSSLYAGSQSDTTFTFDTSGNDNALFGDASSAACSAAGDCSYDFTAATGSTGNQVTAGAGTETVTATASSATFAAGSGADTFTVTGSSNTFNAGAGNDSFYDTGSSNTVSFAAVGSTQTSQLYVDINAGAQTVGGHSLQSGEAASATASYNFQTAAGTFDSSPFTIVDGSTNQGYTNFYLGASGGVSLDPNQGPVPGDTVSFEGSSNGVVVNLSGGSLTVTATIASDVTVTGFNLASDSVLVENPTASESSCASGAAYCDTLGNVTNVTGPPAGFSTFYAGPGPTASVAYNFTGQANDNTFYGGAGQDSFTGDGSGDRFVAGSGPDTFTESTTGGSNTIDFSAVPVGPACSTGSCTLLVNLSGSLTAVQSGSAALLSGTSKLTTYSFETGSFSTFIGALGGDTTFQGGHGSYDYVGQGSSNSLDFSEYAPPSGSTPSLAYDVTSNPGQATLDGTPEAFSDIFDLIGLSGGNTSFQAGSTGGYTFDGIVGADGANTAVFSSQGPSTTLTATVSATQTVNAGTVSFYLNGDVPLCSGVPVQSSGGTATASCVTSSLPAGNDPVLSVYTPAGGSPLAGSAGTVAVSVTAGSASTEQTTTTTITSPSLDAVNAGVNTLTATVSAGSGRLPTDGTVEFAVAGGSTLCVASVPGGSATDPATCTGTLPEGSFDLVATYIPPTGSATSGSYATLAFTASSTQTPTIVTFDSASCIISFLAQLYCSLSATVTSSGAAVTSGTVTFELASSSGIALASYTGGGTCVETLTSTTGGTATCQSAFSAFGNSVIAYYTPPQGSTLAPSATATVVDPFLSQLSVSPQIAGTVYAGIQATITVGVEADPNGGTLSFNLNGTTFLGSVTVPADATNANFFTTFPATGTYDLIVTYTPVNTAANAYSPSVSTLLVTVSSPVQTATTLGSVQDSQAGITVNLYSSAPTTGQVTTSASTTPTSVTLGPGQVLVAAPSAGVTTCQTAALASFCDTLQGISNVTGSSGGHNTFVAGTSSETFNDTGSVGADTANFGFVGAGNGAVLTVNVTGIGTTYVATLGGSSVTYTFNSDFTSFTGSQGGFTTFLAGGSPGLSFVGLGSGNEVSFAADGSPVVVNLSGSAFLDGLCSVGGGQALVTSVGVCKTDSLSGVSTVAGSGVGGDTFVAGGSAETFLAGGGGGASETVSFANVSSAVVVNVSASGLSPEGVGFGTAVAGGVVYTFSSFDTSPINFVGSPGGSTFYAGSEADSFVGFVGVGGTSVLSFADAQTGSLTVCTVASSYYSACATGGVAVLGTGTKVSFSNISTIDGLSSLSGSTLSTVFVAGDTGGYTFVSLAGAATADFSTSAAAVTANLASGTVSFAGTNATDSLVGVGTVYGSAGGSNSFTVGNGSESFGDRGSVGGDSISFSTITATNANSGGTLTVNATNSATTAANPYSATLGSTVYSFSAGGPDFTAFTGATSGYTTLIEPGSAGGISFVGAGPSNTVDFSADRTGLTVDLSTLGSPTPSPGSAKILTATGSVVGADTLSGSIAKVIGSEGPNTFYGGLTGTEFTSDSTTNTVSYVKLTAGAVQVDLATGTVGGIGVAGSDSYVFAFGTPTIQGSPGSDVFVVGQPGAVVEGGGGSDTLDLAQIPAPPSGTSGVDVNLEDGTISGTSIAGVTFTPCSATQTAAQLCLASITGSPYNDVYTLAADQLSLPALAITGGGGSDTLDLSQIASAVTVTMPTAKAGCVLPVDTTTPAGTPCPSLTAATPAPVTFTGVVNLSGTESGSDYVYAGSGAENLSGGANSSGTLDFSQSGFSVSVTVSDATGLPEGTATNSFATISDTFSGFTSFVGTPLSDSFTQTGPGDFSFDGAGGANTLNLSGSTLVGAQVTLFAGSPGCATGTADGTVTLSGVVSDTFECMSNVGSSTSAPTYLVSPGQTATVNGGGSGVLELCSAAASGALSACTLPSGPVTVNLVAGTVTGGGYDFSFTGVTTVEGTGLGDTFIAGPGSFKLNSEGGNAEVSFAAFSGPVVVNDSASSYTIPSGYSIGSTLVPGDTVPAGTATSAFGTISLTGIADITATASYNDIIVAGSAPATLVGGAGADRFVLSGGIDSLYAGTGDSTIDLSSIDTTGPTTLDLASSAMQPLGMGGGYLQILGGNITTVVASPNGSDIWGGQGNLTLVGGPGADWLAAGAGNETITGGGGTDTLLGGTGTDTLVGGTGPVTFVPGSGTDTLTSTSTANTLDYQGAPSGVEVNLSSNIFSVPSGEPFAGTTLAPLQATGGWGATVNLAGAGITAVDGTSFADLFVTSNSDTINGGGGNDLFVVAGSNNNLQAGAGSQSVFLFEASGSNVISGGGMSTVDFSPSNSQVTVNLQAGFAEGGFGGFQQLSGILNIVGSNLAPVQGSSGPTDILIAGSSGATVAALNGGAFIQSAPGGGDTLIDRGSGPATFCAASNCQQSGTTAGGGDTMYGGSGQNYFFAQNNVVDNIVELPGSLDYLYTDPSDKVSVA
jgi:Ca2+-binding RTX toxin-like protein